MNGQARRAARPAFAAALAVGVLCLLVSSPADAHPAVPAVTTSPTASATVAPGTSIPDPGAPPVTTDVGGRTTTPVVEAGPLAAQITTEQYAIDLLNEQVTALDEDVSLAQRQSAEAYQNWAAATEALRQAERESADAAARAYQDASNLGPFGAISDELSGLGVLSPAFGEVVPATPPDPRALAMAAHEASLREQVMFAAYHSAQLTEQALTDQQQTLREGRDQRSAALQDLIARNHEAAVAAAAVQAARNAALAGRYAAGSNVKGMVANPKAIQALAFALSQRGKPYEWGAEGPNSYDCSGLVWASYRSVGVTLPRTAHEQQHALAPVPVEELLPGDLIFFNPTSTTDWTTVSHVGIYYGNGQMVEAPTFGQVVKIETVWWSAYFSAARIFPAVPAPGTSPTPSPTPGPTSPSPSPSPSSTPPSSSPSPTGSPKPSSTKPSSSGSPKPSRTPSTSPTPSPTP